MTWITRSGIGYDVHRFGDDGRPLVLGGVEIPGAGGLVGHSDADVVTHAVADALLGAMGLGDLGTHFPPSDPGLAGVSSLELLADVRGRVEAAGGRALHVDVTVIAERPRLTPHVSAMRARLARVLGLPVGSVSVKATTHEGVGALGRAEAIAAMAVATVSCRSEPGEAEPGEAELGDGDREAR